MRPRPRRDVACLLASLVSAAAPAVAQVLPAGFKSDIVAAGLDRPVAIAFTPDGRLFVAEQRGMVWVREPGSTAPPTLFIDLREEVGDVWDRGLLGLALDPSFAENHRVYLLFTVDPIYGRPDEPGETGTFCRLVRYAGTPMSDGAVADLSTRTVLIGATPSEGIPTCFASHTIGSVRFGTDGSLFVSSGDGASFNWPDSGGTTPSCFVPGLFGPEEDIGAFRSQSLESLAGKVLRIDPSTGDGFSDNPFFDGDPQSKRSRIWTTGLRNPFRFSVRPESPPPGTLYIGDVGWFLHEEINIARAALGGGDNFGWPCFEGDAPAPEYPQEEVPFYACDTIGTPANPGPLRGPAVRWHHGNPQLSNPPGFVGFCSIGGVFYTGTSYPTRYRGRYFFGDFSSGWIRALSVSELDVVVKVDPFATVAQNPVDFATHPVTGDIHYVAYGGTVRRIRWTPPDFDQDGDVDGADLGVLLGQWGQGFGLADLNFDGSVDGSDLGILLAAWTG
ncbi:MAG TPA: PQQ-dependent sugar dehydrogenase [Phycisphaerales bacterium]|nr:PQQ-dependent sugar dehydrogenase [Phycisphaerales bacterium]HMP36959.1 PQQ-dependent sugar dehydrogenase [Phycisphaerales bacterium]